MEFMVLKMPIIVIQGETLNIQTNSPVMYYYGDARPINPSIADLEALNSFVGSS